MTTTARKLRAFLALPVVDENVLFWTKKSVYNVFLKAQKLELQKSLGTGISP
jgi:hypothetical protein